MNRDRKKQSRPFKPEDFYWYDDERFKNLPEPKYGAAALKPIENDKFPTWALFTFNDLKTRAADALPPELLCYQCEDAIILAPSIDNGMIRGMLIATNKASNQIKEMISPEGHMILVRMPELPDKVQADEEANLRILC